VAHPLATNPLLLQINGDWEVQPGEQVVVVYDGNVEVNANQTVSTGVALMIVAGGNITFGGESAEGIYIADDYIITSDVQDVPFTGEGTFIGWSGISLNRDLGLDTDGAGADLGNDTTLLFLYRLRWRVVEQLLRWGMQSGRKESSLLVWLRKASMQLGLLYIDSTLGSVTGWGQPCRRKRGELLPIEGEE
jgi:hypothetical protein